MAARFGGRSAASLQMGTIRWMIGGLSTVVMFLTCTLFYISFGAENETTPSLEPGPTIAQASAIRSVPVLVASERIEEGSQLHDSMFIVDSFPEEKVPLAAIPASERQTVPGLFAKRLILPGYPVSREDLTTELPLSNLIIPAGYRAATINVDPVDGFSTPGSRVDVLWTHTDKQSSTKVVTLIHFAKVLSILGLTKTDGRVDVNGTPVTVTLLVTERDAKRLELARNLGKLSLSLLGKTEFKVTGNNEEVIDIWSLIGTRPEGSIQDQNQISGTAIDHSNNKIYKLHPQGWQIDRDNSDS